MQGSFCNSCDVFFLCFIYLISFHFSIFCQKDTKALVLRRGSIFPACYVVFFPHSIPFYSLKAKKLLLQINFLRKIKTQSEIACWFFLRPRSDHCPSLAVTKQLTQWLSPFVETWMMWLWLREMPTIQICQKHHKYNLTNQIQKIKPTKSPVPNQV